MTTGEPRKDREPVHIRNRDGIVTHNRMLRMMPTDGQPYFKPAGILQGSWGSSIVTMDQMERERLACFPGWFMGEASDRKMNDDAKRIVLDRIRRYLIELPWPSVDLDYAEIMAVVIPMPIDPINGFCRVVSAAAVPYGDLTIEVIPREDDADTDRNESLNRHHLMKTTLTDLKNIERLIEFARERNAK